MIAYKKHRGLMLRIDSTGRKPGLRAVTRDEPFDSENVFGLEASERTTLEKGHRTGSRLKRLGDIVVSALLLMFISPLLVVLALLVKRDGGPAIFSHERVGQNGKLFRCLKFRSMQMDAEDALAAHLLANPIARREWEERQKLENDVRITKIGRILRLWSLDELPQLVNVLRGEMSLIGPRPITTHELSRYGTRARHYLRCVPGISGLWQVSGRNETTYRRRVAIDTVYAQKQSLWLDLVIMLRTIPVVITRKGAE